MEEEGPTELLNLKLDDEEEILHISFVEDSNPINILLITSDKLKGSSISRILSIKQEQAH